jgi:SAM-dependent methyltransferase
MARQLAVGRRLSIRYEVRDICDLPREGERYDLVVDSYCLQCIARDAERARVFAGVRARLKPEGYYLISTAMFDENRFRQDCLVDTTTGIVYHRYGEDQIMDVRTATVYQRLGDRPTGYDGVRQIEGDWYLLHRKHLKGPTLRAELEAAGFQVLYQDDQEGGNLICAMVGGGAAPLSPVSGT